jgi:hypothetical protein
VSSIHIHDSFSGSYLHCPRDKSHLHLASQTTKTPLNDRLLRPHAGRRTSDQYSCMIGREGFNKTCLQNTSFKLPSTIFSLSYRPLWVSCYICSSYVSFFMLIVVMVTRVQRLLKVSAIDFFHVCHAFFIAFLPLDLFSMLVGAIHVYRAHTQSGEEGSVRNAIFVKKYTKFHHET